MAVGPEAGVREGTRSTCDNTRQEQKRSNCLRSLRSRTGGSLAESLTFLQGEARKRARLLNDGRLPRITLPLGQRGEPLLFCSEYLLGWSVVPSGLWNPLALPVLPGPPVSFFLCPSLGLALGQHLTLTTGQQNYSIFLASRGTKLTEMSLWGQKRCTRPKALVSGPGLLFVSQQKLLCPACEKSVSGRVELCETFETSPVFADMSSFGFGVFFP